ncbi:MAG: hypothetical protein E7441_05785 [Ruminococcaceae bacterium]|nr:hypothetical protein [Oscillospiraceae bacterium]
MKKVFEFKNQRGKSVEEFIDNKTFKMVYSDSRAEYELELYTVDEREVFERNVFLGYTKDEIIASGRDVLGEYLNKDGESEYAEVKKVLNVIEKDAYSFLGGPASWSGLMVYPDGAIYSQPVRQNKKGDKIFDPVKVDDYLGKIKPVRMLLAKEYPIMISLHTDGVKSLELMYFVEAGETDREPIAWIRVKKYDNATPEDFTISYQIGAIAREEAQSTFDETPPSEEVFLDTLLDTVSYWIDYYNEGAQISICEKEVERVSRGAMAFSAITFTGDFPHYGHNFYAREFHDNFPPNYIWSIEAACLMGRKSWAKDIFNHLIKYAVNSDGRICYRQGIGLHFGVSATEYAMVLHLAARYKKVLGLDNPDAKTAKKLLGMCEQILCHFVPCEEFDNLMLIKMCAEADTNERVNVYLNNNLWAIRGFDAICSLFENSDIDTSKYKEASTLLSKNINIMIEKYTERNTRFGDLVPFRFDYTATPLTLSVCRDTFYEVPEVELEAYLYKARTRGPEADKQDITENTYANYRYYPEALCSMLIPGNLCDNIVKMREALGGELCGMTRFRHWVDNWPVVNYARFLIETKRIEKYILLLWAHTAHHGRPDLMVYYEQFLLEGTPDADDCVPSLLTTPIMLGWMFAYETVNGKTLRLLSALPKKWFKNEFSASGIGYSDGEVSIKNSPDGLIVEFSNSCPRDTELYWRVRDNLAIDDIESGKEFIKEIKGNVIILKESIKKVLIKVKE